MDIGPQLHLYALRLVGVTLGELFLRPWSGLVQRVVAVIGISGLGQGHGIGGLIPVEPGSQPIADRLERDIDGAVVGQRILEAVVLVDRADGGFVHGDRPLIPQRGADRLDFRPGGQADRAGENGQRQEQGRNALADHFHGLPPSYISYWLARNVHTPMSIAPESSVASSTLVAVAAFTGTHCIVSYP